MLGKAATHFRPLLRLQNTSHAAQPDLFTSNPSLLHHFQTSGANGLVAQAQSSASNASSGAAGGAGRAGYSGASSGGGYTGHARAFLSLPQNNGADASSIGASADERNEAAARQRAHLALKQRIASTSSSNARDEHRSTRVVVMRDNLAARQGSRPVKLIEMEQELEPTVTSKRPSITYPAWAALPADAAPGGALWLPGAAPRQQLGARAFSTRATSRPELVSRSPAPESQRLEQPNRVLMDLAGLDLGDAPRRGHVRRNSTASVVRPDPQHLADNSDMAVFDAIRRATNVGDGTLVRRLVSYYRSPRGKGTPEAPVENLPLPQGYTTQTYNACLQGALAVRERGESIAPILDMYNEMLARDVVPNMRTTTLVIRALCFREEDVAAASRRWAHDRDLATLKAERLRLPSADTEGDAAAAAAIEAYQNENNLASAIRLYNVAKKFHPRLAKQSLEMYADIVGAAGSAAGLPHAVPLSSVLPIVNDALESAERHLWLNVYASIFDLLATATPAELPMLQKVWDRFAPESAEACKAPNPDGMTEQELEAALNKQNTSIAVDRDVAVAAVRAFVALGQVEQATKIVEDRLADPLFAARQSRGLISALVASLAIKGELDAALQWRTRAAGDFLAPADQYALIDALVTGGRGQAAVEAVRDLAQCVNVNMVGQTLDQARMSKTYIKALVAAVEGEGAAAADALETANQIVTVATPRFDSAVLRIHFALLLAAGQYAEIPRLLFPFRARTQEATDPDLRAAMGDLITSPAPIQAVLDMVRACARLGEPINAAGDAQPFSPIIVSKYLAARAELATPSLALSMDQWFRLVEAFVSLPAEDVHAGTFDAALEVLIADLGEFRGTRTLTQFITSSVVADLAEMLVGRFGAERASELITSAFGDKGAALLPTPEATVGASETEFTLPATPASAAPPSSLQPPSPHTLHISSQLCGLIDKLAFPRPPMTPEKVYETVRSAISRDNSVPSPDAMGHLIAALARAGDEPKVRELYSLAQVVLASCVPNPPQQAEGWRVIEDAMIAACCFLGHLEQAGMHRARIIDAGMVPSADAYATMIACSRDSTDDALVARELFDESQALGVVPHLYLFNTIISKLSKARKAEMALELFGHMKAAGIRPSSVTYGAIINACCRVGDAESASTLFDEMSSQPNFKPRVPPFNTMMQFHLQTRPSREKVLYYYDRMRAAGVRPSAHTYKLLLDAYGTLPPADLAAMDRVFGELCANTYVPVQGTHWASLITAFGLHAGDVDRAMAVFDAIPTHPSTKQGTTPEPVVWEAALNMLGQQGTLEQLEALRQRMEASGARPTAYVCNVLIAGYSRHGAIDRARGVFESMGDSLTGVAAPNNHPALLTSSGHVKPATITPAPTNVVFREPSTYEAMVRAELRAGNKEAAEQVLRRMEERRYPVAVWMKARAILDEIPVAAVA